MQTWTCIDDGVDGSYTYWPSYDPAEAYQYMSPVDCSSDPSRCPTPYFGPLGGDYGITEAPPDTVDNSATPLTPIPTCPRPATDTVTYNLAWCAGIAPLGFRLTRIRAALDSMQKLGGVCATLAAIGDSLIVHNAIHLYDPSSQLPKSGYSPLAGATAAYGGPGGSYAFTNLSIRFVDLHYDALHTTTGEPIRRDLQELLAHELDHLNGQVHLQNSGGWLTPNSESCGGVT